MTFTRSDLSKLKKEELISLLLKKEKQDQSALLNEQLIELYIKEIIHLSPDPLLLIDPEGMQLEGCNGGALKLLELDTEEELRQYLADLFQERPLFFELLVELSSTLSDEPEISMEVEFSTSDDQPRYGDMACRKIEVMGKLFLMLRVVDITEIKKNQIRILDSEKQLEIAQEIAKIGSYIYIESSKEFQFSKNCFSILGLEIDDARPHSLKDLLRFVMPDDRDSVCNFIRQLYQHRERSSTEFRISSQGGTPKHLTCIVQPQMDEQGLLKKMVVTLQDISERVHTEQRLRENEERYRLTVENTTDGVWYWNLKTYESYISPKYESSLGFKNSKHDPDGIYRWVERVHPADKRHLWQNYEECARGDKDNFVIEFRYLNQEGKYIWIESRGTLIRDSQQKPHYLLGAMTNIQDRKEAESQLKEQERILNMAQSVAQVGSWIWDCEPDTLHCSDELYRIMQLDTSLNGKALGDEFIKMVVDEDQEMVRRFLNDSHKMEDDKQHVIEGRVQLPSGKIKVLRTTAQVYSRTSQGEVAQLIGTMQDITEDKQRERELIEAKEQAEISQRAKDRFLQIVSHEIRNPLNAIVGITRLLQQARLKKREQEQVETLSFSARHLLSIINDILDTAKLQYGKIKLDHIPFDIKEQLLYTEELFRPMASDQETNLELQFESAIPELVIGDPTRFNQIIFNLLSNAVKYTFRGTIYLKCRMLEESAHFYLIEFKVTDTGTGIPVQNLDKVFEAFEQQGLLSGQQKGGTGLGLYIVKELVSLMRGDIQAESEFGMGTSFTFTLTFDKPEIAEKERVSRPGQQELDLSDKHVLYVEDATYNQLLLKGYAQVWNLRLDLAGSVEEALQMAEAHPYDLVLTDFRLPDGTGMDVTVRLRELPHYQHVPIVAISAYQLEEKSDEYPFDDYLQKPINFDKFLYVLRKYLHPSVALSAGDGKSGVTQSDSALGYLEKYQPEQYQQIMDNLESELNDFYEQLTRSIEGQNYRLYLLTVHKLSSALKMLNEESLLNYLQTIEDLPKHEQAKKNMLQKVSSELKTIREKWSKSRVNR